MTNLADLLARFGQVPQAPAMPMPNLPAVNPLGPMPDMPMPQPAMPGAIPSPDMLSVLAGVGAERAGPGAPQMPELPPPQPTGGQKFAAILKQMAPFLLAAVAARQAGPLGAAGVLSGVADAQARQRKEEQERFERELAQSNNEQDRLLRRQQFNQQRQQAAANYVTSAQAELGKIQDPTQRALTAKRYDEIGQQVYGLPSGSIVAPPDDQTAIQKEAAGVIKSLRDQHGEQFDQLADSSSFPFRGQNMRIRDIEKLAGQVTDASGQPIRPPMSQPALSEFERYMRDVMLPSEAAKRGKAVKDLTPAERREITLQAKKELGQADDRPPASSGGRLSPAMESTVLNRLTAQWQRASQPAAELRRQALNMQVGLAAAVRGDLAAGSQAILVTFQKILDPTSVVRESEYMRSAAGLALMDRIRGYAERLTKGGAGVPLEELQTFARVANEMVSAATGSYLKSIKDRIGRTADHYGIPRDLVFEDFDLTSGLSAPAGQPKEGDELPVPGHPGVIAVYRSGRWIVK